MNYKTAQHKNTKHKLFRKIAYASLWTVVGLFFLFALFTIVDKYTCYCFPIFGYRTSVIVSDSMSKDVDHQSSDYLIKQIQVNDVIVTNNVPYDNLAVGDVITYYDNDKLICHRLVEKYKSNKYQYLVTKGDANTVADPPINYSAYRGKVVNIIPGVGVIVSFMHSYYMIIALVCASLVIVVSDKYIAKIKQQKNENI